VVALALGAMPARAATISLDVLSPAIAGASFDVAVVVTDLFAGRPATDALVGFGFDVTVGDPSVVEFVDATEGPLFDPLIVSPGTPMVIGFSTNLLGIGPGDVSGPLTLAVLHFKALVAGLSGISVVGDSFPDTGLVFAELPYESFNQSVNVSAAAAAPEPASLVLFGTVLLGIAFARRRSARTRR
jgi:hypothetical protein